MYCTVLVQLRHKDIFKAVAPHAVIEPNIELFHNGVDIVSVYLRPVQITIAWDWSIAAL